MIVLVHDGKIIVAVLNENLEHINDVISLPSTLLNGFRKIIESKIETLVIWCHEKLLQELNIAKLDSIFHHEKLLISYNTNETNYIPDQIGYVERSFFVKINKDVTYPTWLMSSHVGGVNTRVINCVKHPLDYNESFDYFLNSLAKSAMVEGLFCYSEPKLLKDKTRIKIETIKAKKSTLFKFVKQHYKWVWFFFLAWCYAIYERKTTICSITKHLFVKQLKVKIDFDSLPIKSSKKVTVNNTVDVVIPTIGRKKYLYDVLKDLSNQTLLPKNVIIVEQNPVPNSFSELEYLQTQIWPFNVKHEFIAQIGVCNARNIALSKVESEWVFFADDDIRFNSNFLELSLNQIKQYGITVLNYLCLLPKQKQTFFKMHQTTIFGSGSSMVASKALKNIEFNTAYEFGFGEDTEFGMQLRNKGEDVIFIPNLKITHLKAPFGGYRTKIKQLWDAESIQPKPSPTIQLLYQTHYTTNQINGYKLLLLLKEFKAFGYKNPFKFKTLFREKWSKSVYWSSKIKANTL